ncbi:DNA repair (Rad51) family protein, partial [Striga asiatica]
MSPLLLWGRQKLRWQQPVLILLLQYIVYEDRMVPVKKASMATPLAFPRDKPDKWRAELLKEELFGVDREDWDPPENEACCCEPGGGKEVKDDFGTKMGSLEQCCRGCGGGC